jgi:SAM-dependent methyltransferase
LAITAIEYWLISRLAQAGLLPQAPHVLECGENYWYGDVPLEKLGLDIYRVIPDPDARKRHFLELDGIAQTPSSATLFELPRLFYRVFLGYASLTSIDLGGSGGAAKVDLNWPVQADRTFDVTINFGTAQHVFNIHQFFKTMHDLTAPGGLMLHGMPFTGGPDDGFYNVQPTFYWDLALANGYEVLMLIYAEAQPFKVRELTRRDDVVAMARRSEIGAHAFVYAALRRGTSAAEFAVPMQGRYLAELTGVTG